MKNHFVILRVLLALLMLSMLYYCKKDALKVAPTVTSLEASNITSNSATAGGAVTADGGDQVTARGICWSPTNTSPTISDSKTSDGLGMGSFASSMTGLQQGTTYYFKAYAINSIGTAYSNTASFKTLAVAPVVTTTDFSSVTASSFNSGGNITSDGGSPVTARGVCWSTNQNPTVADTKTSDGTGTGSFTSSISGLTPGATYYARAYATNSVGSGYGNQITIKTTTSAPIVTTTAITAITSTTASSGGNVTSDGGVAVTARGVCWSTTSSPTIANNKTADGTGAGAFISSITGLTPGSTYYVRAYATNSLGTGYGTEVSFSASTILSTITTTAISNITSTTASGGGNITADGGGAITARGVCWGIASGPTITNSKTTDGTGIGAFTSLITGLAAGTTYYVRSYATNSAGTTYGTEIPFTSIATLPVLTTTSITSISSISASSGGNITSSGGTITARGVCWATSATPTITDNKTSESNDAGTFTSNIAGLSAGTTYYVRAYATNSAGTGYGNAISFTTSIVPPVLTTQNVTSITNMTAKSGGSITSTGGATVTARGVCWSISAGPTINNSKTSDGTGIGNFVSSITGLSATTTYFARAYATNSAGTSYGNEVQFTTPKEGIIFNPNLTYGTATDIDGNEYKTIKIGTQTWMAENLRTTKYRNGDLIGTTSPATLGISGLDAPRYQWAYDGDESKVAIYGRLYTGLALTDNRKICPVGWHVPTNPESNTLQSYLTNNGYGFEGSGWDIGKSIASTFGWNTNTSAGTVGQDQSSNNSSGLTLLPSGYRNVDGSFIGLGISGGWWSPKYDFLYGGLVDLQVWGTSYSGNGLGYSSYDNKRGNPVRCISGEFDLPVITTTPITNVTQILKSRTFSVTSGGAILSDGGTPIQRSGLTWSLKHITSPFLTENGGYFQSVSTSSFSQIISSLPSKTTYYIRAWAENYAGFGFGNELTITTGGLLPVVTTNNLVETFPATLTALCSSIVSDIGDSPLTMRGLCWGTSLNPTTANSYTTDGNFWESFTSLITGLSPNTTYYLRAYATNSYGTGYSDNVTFIIKSSSSGSVTDNDGNVYSTIDIGTQVWMASNLKVTKYNDNSIIPMVSNVSTWSNLATPGYCWYNNDVTNKNIYGGLYNWYTVNTGKLCPIGWHVPTSDEWFILREFLGGWYQAGGKLKEAGTSHWLSPNYDATNVTGFTALPGGYLLKKNLYDTYSTFTGIQSSGNWWTSTPNSYGGEVAGASYIKTVADAGSAEQIDISKSGGVSVRCVKN